MKTCDMSCDLGLHNTLPVIRHLRHTHTSLTSCSFLLPPPFGRGHLNKPFELASHRELPSFLIERMEIRSQLRNPLYTPVLPPSGALPLIGRALKHAYKEYDSKKLYLGLRNQFEAGLTLFRSISLNSALPN